MYKLFGFPRGLMSMSSCREKNLNGCIVILLYMFIQTIFQINEIDACVLFAV